MMISPSDVLRALFGNGTPQVSAVVRSMRLPRLLTAALVGAGLSVSGCAFQSLFSNPLATPDTLGASLGAALSLLLGFDLIGVQLFSFTFGLIAVALTALSARGLHDSRNAPILAGIMIGSLCTSLVSLVKFCADTESQLPAITYWLMGSMENAGMAGLLFGAPPIIVCTVILLLLRWRLNLLPLAEDEAISSGVRLCLLRETVELCATMITASCVSLCGQVGWVGLLVPYICRMKVGEQSERLLPLCVLIGSSFLMLVDTAARTVTPKEMHFGPNVYLRGIIEFSNICKNDCLYCGIRRSNRNAVRYRFTDEDILSCCEEGHRLGYRTFVLQSGEDCYYTDDRLAALVESIKARYPDCAVTLSVGEHSRESYRRLFDAGADRYLLRHETAAAAHYARLHPKAMSFDERIRCLHDLKEIGYQVGCGMMVGTPYQTAETLAEDMELMRDFRPHMVGIGPFLPHKDTPFADRPAGNQALTLFLLSLTRPMLPDVLLPATTALGTLTDDGRILGLKAGCNVVMPNLSPRNIRKHYMLYDNKTGTELTAEESTRLLTEQIRSIGRNVVIGRGGHRDFERKDAR